MEYPRYHSRMHFVKLPKVHIDLSRTLPQIDKRLFVVKHTVPAIRCASSQANEIYKRAIKDGHVLNIPRVKSVIKDASECLVLLCKDATGMSSVAGLATETYELCLDYDYWTAEEILQSILPDDVIVPTSFEQVGHLIHLNLQEEHEPFKFVIAQVLLDKNTTSKTVVNKKGNITDVFRTFEMEFLAGETRSTVVKVKEEGCTFEFDYSKVYWNSRLQTEHRRLVQSFERESRVCDVFAGVGPFSVPAAKLKKCIVWANDLNPSSVSYLKRNASLNNVTIKAYNLDANKFLEYMFNEGTAIDHFILNLPASAHLFLEAFAREESIVKNRSTIHCYIFAKSEEDPKELIERSIHPKRPKFILVHRVRNVAPNKDMYCVSFQLL